MITLMVEITYKSVKESSSTCFPDGPLKGGDIVWTSMTPFNLTNYDIV